MQNDDVMRKKGLISKLFIRRHFESCNVNFLFGSGMSLPFLKTLGNIEHLLTSLEQQERDDYRKDMLKASIYAKFFLDVIWPNHERNRNGNKFEEVKDNYIKFIKLLNRILNKRANASGLSRRLNIFTTNIDVFFEIALESAKVEWNAGFSGMMTPTFSESNFCKAVYSTSRYYNRRCELPVFNLYKLHGSLNWHCEDKSRNVEIQLDRELKGVLRVNEILEKLNEKNVLLDLRDCKTLEDVYTIELNEQNEEKMVLVRQFIVEYEKLSIVNPSKKKFSTTVLDVHFYELMRIYANELERNNSVLFVHGFSFADEHFANITKRVAATNPTLSIFVIAYDVDSKKEIMSNLKLEEERTDYMNISVLTCEDFALFEENENLEKMSFDNVVKLYSDVISCDDYIEGV